MQEIPPPKEKKTEVYQKTIFLSYIHPLEIETYKKYT